MSCASSGRPGEMSATAAGFQPLEQVPVHGRAIGHSVLRGALLFFLAAKLLWVLAPAAVMGVPRLGDDALVYLWNGANSVVHPYTQSAAVQDILRLRGETAATSDLDRARARVTMRTTGVSASPFALATGALLQTGLSHRAVFAWMEAFIALCLALGVTFCLRHVAGPAGTAGALALLALAILPNQGLHYLVPSVLTLSIGLVLWTVVLQQRGGAALVLLLAVLMLLVHPIGPVYVLVAAALVAAKAILHRRLGRAAWLHLAALGLSWPLWRGILAASGASEPPTTGLGGLSLSAVPVNVAGLLAHLKSLALQQPVLAVLLVLGLAVAVIERKRNGDAFVLAGVLLAVVLSTVLVDIPGYPGELPSRALIGLVIVCSGLGAGWVLQRMRRLAHPRRWVALGLVLAWSLQAPQFVTLAFANINSRHQIYDSALLQHEIAQLPDGAGVVWVDTDVALMGGLLAGAARLHAAPYPMIGGTASITKALDGAAPVFVATTSPERLNGLSSVGAWSLQPRYYGYDLRRYRRVSVYARGDSGLPHFVRLQGADAAAARVTSGPHACTVAPAASTQAGWYRIAGCEPRGELHIAGAGERVQVTGLSMGPPDPARPWPWGQQGLRLRAEPRPDGDAAEVLFDWSFLLGPQVAARLQSELGPLSLVSSASGIVWLKAGVPTEAKP